MTEGESLQPKASVDRFYRALRRRKYDKQGQTRQQEF